MRWVIWGLSLTAMIGNVALADTLGYSMALPDSSDLRGGVFIAHYCEPIGYTVDAPDPLGWCGEYMAQYAIDNCNDQVNRVDTATYMPVSWFVLSAWTEPKKWCGTEFGLGDYSPGETGIFGISEYNCCFPTEGLAIPTPGWPGPNEGIALAVTDTLGYFRGNFVPVMHLGGYAYGYSDPGVIPLDTDPPTLFAGWTTCPLPGELPEAYPAEDLGGLGVNMDGIWVCPDQPPPLTVCCAEDGDCTTVASEQECIDLGGTWHEEWDNCDPNPCPQPKVCCYNDGLSYTCATVSESQCSSLGGEWHGDLSSCEPFPDVCYPWACIVAEACTTVLETECDGLEGTWYQDLYCSDRHVCCVDIECYIVWEQGCTDLEGEWRPDEDSCDPNPCTGPAVRGATWGSIKSIYR